MKNDLIYVNADKVDYVKIRLPNPWSFRWFEAKEPTYKFFGLIKTKEGHQSGWSTYHTPTHYNIHSTKELLEDNYFYVDENVSERQWFKKPYVYIRMGRNYIGEYFNTLEEAKEFVNEMLDKSKSKFQVLIEKT